MQIVRLVPASRVEPLEARIAPAAIYAVDTNNRLVAFDSTSPETLDLDLAITGLQPGEEIRAIDVHPPTGAVYALGLVDNGATRTGRLYQLNPATAAATLVGNSFFSDTLADTGNYGMDFTSSGGLLRVVNGVDANFIVNFLSGTIFQTHDDLNDPNQIEEITGLAYSETFGSAPGSAYVYNAATNEIGYLGEPGNFGTASSGVITPIAPINFGGLTVDPQTTDIAFDIAGLAGGPDLGWMLFRFGGESNLYNVDLATGTLNGLGEVGDGSRTFFAVAVQFYTAGPAIAPNGKSATWTDLDGDLVTVKITKGTLTPANFRMLAGANGVALSELKLTDPAFTGSNVTFTAKRGPAGGDGFVNVGDITATGVDLGNVTVPGDLVRIVAGTDQAPAPSVKVLTARSLDGVNSGFVAAPTLGYKSNFVDGATRISIAGDVTTGLNFLSGKTGLVSIGGNLVGGDSLGDANLNGNGLISKLVIKGNMIGGGGTTAVVTMQAIPSIIVGGSIVGGTNSLSGGFQLSSLPGVKTVITIGGSLIGGPAPTSGVISVGGEFSLKIGGQILGGAGDGSGAIRKPFQDSILTSLTVGGIQAGSGERSGSIEVTRIGALTVKGSVVGTESSRVTIAATGMPTPAKQADAVAVGRVTVGGDFLHTSLVAGLEVDLDPVTADAAIGAVKIGRNFVASNIAAGIHPDNGFFGDGDDAFATANGGNPEIIARVASVLIGGQAVGTASGLPDSFGIEAEHIGAVTVGKAKLLLTAANQENLLVSSTGDIRIKEFSPN